ncbi:MAG: serine/threonine protein kinase [Myxococcaceae bacterium]|nr:serine/threonine protein kinase [Myxococcaceae bacterium]
MKPTIGRFELVRRLGRGGMGEVFLARDGDRQVVLKRLLPHLAHDRVLGEAFLREAGVAARLSHPNIARVLELGEASGGFFFTMEYVEGCDVRALGPLPVPVAAQIVADAARALEAAHSARDTAGRPLGVVHGDVTPKNLLVSADGVTRLIDFGLAKVRANRDEDSAGGTWEYLAPEHALEGTTDERTDQFSLGVVAWELLTGRRLFAGDTDTLTLDQVVACRVTPPRQVNPAVPPELDALVMRMLARDPAARFPRCQDVAEGLERWLSSSRVGDVRAELGGLTQRATEAQTPTPVAAGPAPAPRLPQPSRASTGPLTVWEKEALRRLGALPQPIALETLEQLDLGRGAPPVLDVAQVLVERGLLVRTDDGAFVVAGSD